MTGQFLSKPAGRRGERLTGIPRLIVLLVTAALLAGCSIGLVYPRLDMLASWQLDRYLRLESGQERWLDERLAERLAWHQREQLPRWRDALVAVRGDIAADRLDAERHRQYNDTMRELIRASMTGLIDDTAQLASGLNDAQAQHLLAHFDEETEELQEEIAEAAAEPVEAEQDRYDELKDGVEQWLGDLSQDQEAYLKQWRDSAIRWDDYALDARQRWRQFISLSMSQRADPVATRAAVEQMFLRPESLRSEAYQEAVTRQAERRRELHLYLLQTMSEQQKQHLLNEFDELIEEVDELLAD